MPAAAGAYEAALQRWPQWLEALIGLGNAHIMQGEWEAAEAALRRAVAVNPQSGDAANNLAHDLARNGQIEEALEWSRRAVAIGGPNQTIYRQTLEEIEAMRKQEPSGGLEPFGAGNYAQGIRSPRARPAKTEE